jgi:CRP-like cAMP-binding protein
MDERNSKHVIPYDDRKKQAQNFKTIIKTNINKKKKNQEKVANAKKASTLVEAKKAETEKEGITFEKMNKEEKYTTLKNEGFMIKNYLNSYIKKKNDNKIDINQLEEELFENERSVSKLVSNNHEKKSSDNRGANISNNLTNSNCNNLTNSNDKKVSNLSKDNIPKNKKASRTSNLPNLSSESMSIKDAYNLDKSPSNNIERVAYSFLRSNIKNNMKGLMSRMRSSICMNSFSKDTKENKENNGTNNSSNNPSFNRRGSELKPNNFRRFSIARDPVGTGSISIAGKSNSMSLAGSNFIENLKNKKKGGTGTKDKSKRNSIDVANMKEVSYNKLNDPGNNTSNVLSSSNPSMISNIKLLRRASAVAGNVTNNLKNNFLVNTSNDMNNNISNRNSLNISNSNPAKNSSITRNNSSNVNASNNSFTGKNSSSKDLPKKGGFGLGNNPNSFLSIINKKILEMSSEGSPGNNNPNNTSVNISNSDFNIKPIKLEKVDRVTSKFNNSDRTAERNEDEDSKVNRVNKRDSDRNIFFVGNESESFNKNHNFERKNSKTAGAPSEREFANDLDTQDKLLPYLLKKKNNSDTNTSHKEKTFNNVNDSFNLLKMSKSNSNITDSVKSHSKRNSIKKISIKYNADEKIQKFEKFEKNGKNGKFEEKNENFHKINETPFLTPNSPNLHNFKSFSTTRLNNMFNGRNLTKLSKVYDSLSDEELEQSFDFLIHPESKIKEAWDFLILLVTLYTITFVPYNMAYLDLDTLSLLIIDLFCDVIYILDLIFQFFIPIQDYDEKYITSKSRIAINYLTSWFILDFLSSVPINSVLSIVLLINEEDTLNSNSDLVVSKLKVSKNLTNIAKLSRMYRLMKLVRLVKLIKISKNQKIKYKEKMNILEDMNISSTLKRLLIFLFYFILLNHVLACIWTFIASLDYPNWIVDQDLTDADNIELYIASLYFNLVTIFTIGYGNIISKNTLERVYNIVIMIAGIMLYTFAVSSLSNIIQRTDEKTQSFNKNLNYLEESKVRYNIPSNLYSKIKRFLTYDYTVNRINKHFLLADLPQVIRSELICRMYADIISNFNFFQNTNTEFCAKVILALRPMKSNKSEVIIYEDEYIEEMVFVKRGVLSIEKKYKESMIRLVELRRREHFGEIFMLLNEKCTYNVSVKTNYCEMLLMKKIDLIDICSEFQDIFEQISNKSTYNMLIIKNRFETLKEAIDRRSSIALIKGKRLLKENDNKSSKSIEEETEANEEGNSTSISRKEASISPSKSSTKNNPKNKANKNYGEINEVIEENSLDEEEDIMRESNSDDSSSSSSSSYNSYTGKTYKKVTTKFPDLNEENENKEKTYDNIMNSNSVFFSNLTEESNTNNTSLNTSNSNTIAKASTKENTKYNAFEVIEEGESDDDEEDESEEEGKLKLDNSLCNSNSDSNRNSNRNNGTSNPKTKNSSCKGFNISLLKVISVDEKSSDNEENKNSDKNPDNNYNKGVETNKSSKTIPTIKTPYQNNSLSNSIESLKRHHSNKSMNSTKSAKSAKSKKSHIFKKSKFLQIKNSDKSDKSDKSDNSGTDSSDDSDHTISVNLSQISLDSQKKTKLTNKNTNSASNLNNIFNLNTPLSPNTLKRKNSDASLKSIKSFLLKDKEISSQKFVRKNSLCEFSPYKGNPKSRKNLSSDACPIKIGAEIEGEKIQPNINVLNYRKKSLTMTMMENPIIKKRSTSISPSLSFKEGSLNSEEISKQISDRKKSKNKNKSPFKYFEKSDSESFKIEKSETKENNKSSNNSIEKIRTPSCVKPSETKKLSVDSSFFNRLKDPNLRRNTILIGSTINTNIKKGSQNIKDHKKFYSGIFEKWKMDEQNKRLKLLYKKMKSKI